MNTLYQEMVVRALADGALLLILVIGVLAVPLYLRWNKLIQVMPVAIMAGMTSLLVGKLMSLMYQPAIARPFLELGLEPGAAYIDNPGFPSDHALLGTVAVLAVVVLVRQRVLSIILIALLSAMCVARVAALVHTPVDVIGGIVAGLSGGVWYLLYLPSLRRNA